MPSRVIRGEINESESLAQVSVHADLTFRALLVAVDDYGRFDARPNKLKAALFPMRDEVSAEIVLGWVGELAALPDPPVVLYEVDGRPYLHLPNWEKHRGKGRRASESRYPEPPTEGAGKSRETSGTPGTSATCAGDPRKSAESPGDPPVGRGTRDEKRGTRDVGRERPRKRAKTAAPAALDDEQLAQVIRWCREKHPGWAQHVTQQVEACLDWHRGKGNTHADWVATCRTWIRRAAEEHPTGPPRSGSGGRASAGEARAERERQAALQVVYGRRGT